MMPSHCLTRWAWMGSVFTVLLTTLAFAITLGQIDDFEDGSTANWFTQGGSVTFTNINNAGPMGAGDNALNADVPARLVITNETQWAGNYVAARVTQISLDVRHQYSFPLALRIGIANGLFGPGGSGAHM